MSDVKIAVRQRHLQKLKHFFQSLLFQVAAKTNTIMFNKFPNRIQAHNICPAYVHFRQTSRHSFFSVYLLLSCHVPISSLCQFTVHLGLGCLVGQRRWYNGIGCQGWSVSWYRFGLENEERREAGGIEGWRTGRVVIVLNTLTKRARERSSKEQITDDLQPQTQPLTPTKTGNHLRELQTPLSPLPKTSNRVYRVIYVTVSSPS